MVIAGGTDKQIQAIQLSTTQQIVIGSHDAPVRGVRFVDIPGTNGPIVVSGSWDKTVRFWDMRQPGAAAVTLNCDERVYSLDAKAQLLVVATAGLRVHLVDLKNPGAFSKTVDSPLMHQTKAVAAFPDGRGWGIASIEGRCGIQAVDEDDSRYCYSLIFISSYSTSRCFFSHAQTHTHTCFVDVPMKNKQSALSLSPSPFNFQPINF